MIGPQFLQGFGSTLKVFRIGIVVGELSVVGDTNVCVCVCERVCVCVCERVCVRVCV